MPLPLRYPNASSVFLARPRPPHDGAAGSRSCILLLLLFALCGTLLLSACEQQPEKKADTTTVEPDDIFSQRAPRQERRLLVIGDSLSISLGETLEHVLSHAPGLAYTWDGTRSTGLTRPDLLDWPKHLRELLAKTTPDIVVIMLGANDVMPVVTPEGSHVYFDDANWPKAYDAKAQEILAICRQANPRVHIYWVGVPAMGEHALATGVCQVNAALRNLCTAGNCHYIDTHTAFADSEDHFSRHARDTASGETVTLRTADMVHMTDSGAKLLAGLVLDTLVSREHLPLSAAMSELLAQSHDLQILCDGQAATEPQPAPVKVEATGPVYAVRQGETPASIAKRLGIPLETLQQLNPGVDARHLAIGQKLRIPRHR